MSEQSSITKTSEINPRTARAVAAILSQTATDEALQALNQSDGRNQSEQASFLAKQSPFLREIYEQGGTVRDGVLTVPKENLSVPPEIQLVTLHTAVERLTRITGDSVKAKELAPQLVEMGERIAGSQADGETRLKVFGWLYGSLEGKQDLLPNNTQNQELQQHDPSETLFSEKWQQIIALSEALAALEPKDTLPENSLDEFSERETETRLEQVENFTESALYENAVATENSERAEEIVLGGGLIGFERVEIGSDLPKIPESLSLIDFEKLLGKTGEIDSQLERGFPTREILAPFRSYVELTRLDNELRLVEEEYAKVKAKQIGNEQESPINYRFIATREELRELSDDRQTIEKLSNDKTKLQEIIKNGFDESVDRPKVEQSNLERNFESGVSNQIAKKLGQKIELSEDETELQKFLIQEKSILGEIETLSESISERENSFRPFKELTSEQIAPERQRELTNQVLSLELPVPSVLKEKHPELTPKERKEKLTRGNTFEIQSPAEYLFVKEAANKHFLVLREREIKNEYRKFDNKNVGEFKDSKLARQELTAHREKLNNLKSIEPIFAYKIKGSNRIINAKPSERSIAGYKFANEFIHYQLKQPETRLRRESIDYRQYAERLESAKTSQDVIREAYKIRQENHQAVGVWKNVTKEERRELQRPLTKNEMTLLFLEQPTKNYTAEMSVLKYNFAHYSEAKRRMTDALETGKLEPSAEAKKLVESLESRLGRRNLQTKQKATKHFFESLKTENNQLFIKNDFDHQSAYQKLPPHEKDWVYRSALEQKENLEYKIAFEQVKKAATVSPTPNLPATSEITSNLREEFSAGTLWHQAAILSNQRETKDFVRNAAKIDEKMLQSIGFLIHNQSQTNNLRVGEWLEKQKSAELKTAGEILKTFANATREIKKNQLTLSVKITESERVSASDYKSLFERYFPERLEKHQEFHIGENEKFKLEQSRRNGQSELLNSWINDTQTAIYRTDTPASVFENEQFIVKEIEKIKASQIECRRANETKNAIALKIEEKTQKELAKNSKRFSNSDLQTAVKSALMAENSDNLSGKQKAIFQIAQDKISISEFEKFTTNSKQLENGLLEINQSFERIAELRLENLPYIIQPEKTEQIESLQKLYETNQKQSEAHLITIAAREKFLGGTISNSNESINLTQSISAEELEKTRIESNLQARIALEPVELNEEIKDREIEAQVLEFADALEAAHQMKLHSTSDSEIASSFAVAEMKRKNLIKSLQKENAIISPENEPITLKIYERELARNEKAIAQAKISEMIETGKISLAELETKKANEIFSMTEREEIRLEAGMRTRENLEPKELWAKRQNLSEKLQQTALQASDALERAHEIYHTPEAKSEEVIKAFSALDVDIIKLKKERRTEHTATKFINFKTEFKRDLAQMFENGQRLENTHLLTAMTKGLMLDALEKQEVQSDKIGLSSEKLTEISRTIILAMAEENKRENILSAHKSPVSVQESRHEQSKSSPQNQMIPTKIRQFEHHR